MDDFFAVTCFVTLYILIFGLLSKLYKDKLHISDPLIGVLYGIIIGPSFLGLLVTKYKESKIVIFYLAKVVLCVQTMQVAIGLPHNYILENRYDLFMMVVVVGLVKFLVTSLIIYAFLPYNFMVSLAISACLTPTDPVLANSIIKSRFAAEIAPERLRTLLSAESGINDGFGLFLLFVPVDLYLSEDFISGIQYLLLVTVLYKAVMPAFIGLLTGYLARNLLLWSKGRNSVDSEIYLSYTTVLTFFVLGFMETLGMSDLIGIFFAGTAFNYRQWYTKELNSHKILDLIERITSTAFFILFGTRINLNMITIMITFTSAIILLFRRTSIVYVLEPFIPGIRNKREALFVGYFGPIGVGGLYYSLMFDRIFGTMTYDYVSVLVLYSVILHGLSVAGIKILDRRYKCISLQPAVENYT